MKKQFTILILSAVFLICVSAVIPRSLGFSTVTTALKAYGFDTNQQTFAFIGGFYVYAFDNKMVFYNSEGTLVKTWTVNQSWTLYDAGTTYYNCSRTNIIALNSTHLIVASIIAGIRNTDVSIFAIYGYNIGLLEVSSLSYKPIVSSHDYSTTTRSGSGSGGVGGVGTGLILCSYANSSGTFYYAVMGAKCVWYSPPNYYYGEASQVGFIGTKSIAGVFTAAFAERSVSHTNAYVMPNAVWVNGADGSFGYVLCTNSWVSGGNRALLYRLMNDTLTYVTTSPNDWDYTGAWQNPYGTYCLGFTYLIGAEFKPAANVYCVNIAYSYASGGQFGLVTLVFNETYFADSNLISLGALNSDSQTVRPFTVAYPVGGNCSDGTYTIAIWHNIIANDVLTGCSYTVSGLAGGAPTWTSGQQLFEYTPQQPQTFNFTSSTDMGGFVISGYPVGVEVNMIGWGSAGTAQCVGQTFYDVNPTFTFQGVLSGDIFGSGTVIAQYPTQITLKQSFTSYHFYGFIYTNGQLSVNGSYTLYSTGLSVSSYIPTTGTYAVVASGSITLGMFDFALSSRVSANNVAYEGYKVGVTTATEGSTNYTYFFGWYKLGGSDINGTIPYPSIPGGTPITPSPGVIDGSALSAFLGGYVSVIVLFIVIGAPALILGGVAGLPGLIVGGALGIGVGVLGGLLPLWFVIILGVAMASAFFMWRKNNGQG